MKELEGTGDREMVLASGAKSTQKSLQTSSRTHSSIEIDRQKFYKSETQRRDKRQHKGAKPDRQLLGQEVQISPDIARLFQTIDRLNLSGTIKSQKEEEKITSFQSHRHQPRLDNVSSSNSKSTQQSSQNSSQDTSSVDINPQTPTLSLNTLNPTGGQKRQETKENVQLNNPPLVQVSPTTSPQGMRLRQSSAGIAGILRANLKTPDLSQEVTQANDREKQEQTEQSQSNDSASSLTSSSPLVPMSKESAMEQIMTKLTENLEFEYLRTYGNLPGE